MDPSLAADPRVAIQSIITEGVELVLALREREKVLQELSCQASSHDIRYAMTRARRDEIRKDLDGVVARLAELPHVPRELNMQPFRVWLEEHRETFETFAGYCEQVLRPASPGEVLRPASPLEEGEVHPDVERLSAALDDMEHRIDRLERAANPQAFELQERVARVPAAHEESQLFSKFMNRLDFAELSEKTQRVAIRQHGLKIAVQKFKGLTGMDVDVEDVLFWQEPLKRV